MPRRPKCRWVEALPGETHFKPTGRRLRDLEEVTLTVDELEALRLKDLEGLSQHQCAERMNVSQSTFQRLLTGARFSLTTAIVAGKALRIDGGNFSVLPEREQCGVCGRQRGRGRRHRGGGCHSCGSELPGGRGYGGPPRG